MVSVIGLNVTFPDDRLSTFLSAVPAQLIGCLRVIARHVSIISIVCFIKSFHTCLGKYLSIVGITHIICIVHPMSYLCRVRCLAPTFTEVMLPKWLKYYRCTTAWNVPLASHHREPWELPL